MGSKAPSPPPYMLTYIVKDASAPEHAAAKAAGHQVIGQLIQSRTADGLDAGGVGTSHRKLEGTRSGPCLVLGMGPSRSKLPKNLTIPVYAINRAALESKPDIWCCHDIEAVLDCHESVPLDVPLATYSCNWLKAGFGKVVESGRKLIFWDIFPDPTRHGRRPLYWNVTTLGPVLDLAVRMGHDPIYTLGTDLTHGGYVNPHYTPAALEVEHEYVRLKMCFMFTPDELPKWNARGASIIDLSLGNAPWPKADIGVLEPYVR